MFATSKHSNPKNMASNSLKLELANHIYKYLCHEAQYSDLPEAARESLTAASECIEQAYKLNANTNQPFSSNTQSHQTANQSQSHESPKSLPYENSILPDELLRIFSRHKEFLQAQYLHQQQQQQREHIKSSFQSQRNASNDSSTTEKPDVRISAALTSGAVNVSDPHQTSSPSTTNNNPTAGAQPNLADLAASSGVQIQHQQSSSAHHPATSGIATAGASKSHGQHAISQLPMTTRKKLSHLRAQIKRQASKAARSRLEKRSSVSGGTCSSLAGVGPHLGGLIGSASIETAAGSHSKTASDAQGGFGQQGACNKDGSSGSQPNSSLDSPSAHAANSTAQNTTTDGAATDAATNSPNAAGHADSGAGHSGHTATKHHLIPGHHHHANIGVSVHQKNFKQKLIALIKKFRTDGSNFDSEEQYREALERELMKAAAGRGSRAIEELLEEDLDVEGDSDSEPEDWDNISEMSTPKPSLRPFFSSTTLDKI